MPETTREGSFITYLADMWTTWWFYLSIIIAVSELYLVISDANVGIALFVRNVLGLGILGLIPGFLTSTFLFPGNQLDTLEKIALSIFLSVLISITTGIILGLKSPFFQASSNIIVLTGYIILADVAASYRSYNLLRTPR